LAKTADARSSGMRGLHTLIMTANAGITDVSALRLSSCLRQDMMLRVLDLGHCRIGLTGIVGLCSAIREGSSQLRVLRLDSPIIRNIEELNSMCVHICSVLEMSRGIEELSLDQWQLTDKHLLTLFGQQILSSLRLKCLSLGANKMGKHTGDSIRRILTLCPDLEEINLSGNWIADEGAVAIADSLFEFYEKDNLALRFLDMSRNQIGDPALAVFSQVLSEVDTLTDIKLWNNRFGHSAGELLAKALQMRDDLRTDFVVEHDGDKFVVAAAP